MKTLVYQMMEQPEWLEKIRNGLIDFQGTITEEEKQAMLKAAANNASPNKGHYWHEF
jgi:hypothetical protein